MKKIFALFIMISALLIGAVFNQEVQAANYTQVEAAHILVPTEQEAINIRKEIVTEGADRAQIFKNFTEAAKKYSKCPSGKAGGVLGWFSRGDMVPEFEKVAFELPNGQVSEPVKTQFGWHLIYDIAKK